MWNTLKWFGHMERKKNEEFVKKRGLSETEGLRRLGRSVIRWRDRVKEYKYELLIEGEGMKKQRGSI